ncbi:MAG: hypothetical protein IPP64_02245 [Bacteroidetes bacterium]|nr:hypothetical protein [Bacteroidota bacterium]
MIDNLPKEISLNRLQKFNFGNIEANEDDLLFDSICRTSSIMQFINGTKNIVLGEKGTGKTALFRLIKEDKLKFNPKNGFKNIIIPIEDNFQYKNIKGKLLNLIKTSNDDPNFKYQVIWELFLFHKITQRLQKSEYDLPSTINKGIDLANKIFSNNGLDDFIKTKRTFGVKLHSTPESISPDLYFTAEPLPATDVTIKEKSLENLELDLDFYKNKINKFLIENELNLIIIIDRLDEFVSKSAADVQLETLEALVVVEREFSRYSNIELKIFLRDDLFKQLSFEGIGYDKVISKKVELIWTPEKIREFIAKRIYSNYKRVMNITSIIANIDKETLEIDTSIDTDNYIRPNFLTRSYRWIVKKLNPEHYAQKFPRKVNLSDDLNKQIILSIFPRYVDFKNEDGKIIEMDIFDYFSNNFNLGTGNSIPRLILIFLEKCLTISVNYYNDNPDQLPIMQNKHKCYELIKKGFFEKAYEEFKKEIYLNFAKLNPEFESKIMLLREKIGNRFTFRARELKGLLEIKEDEELNYFCGYLLHIGFLRLTNATSNIEDMKFELPVMFRNTK